jgi:hypothetical protein
LGQLGCVGGIDSEVEQVAEEAALTALAVVTLLVAAAVVLRRIGRAG